MAWGVASCQNQGERTVLFNASPGCSADVLSGNFTDFLN
jgi:hypothetical protein